MKKILFFSLICLLFGSCTSEDTNWELIYGKWEVYQEKGFDDDLKWYKPEWEDLKEPYIWDIQKDKFYYDGVEYDYLTPPLYGYVTLQNSYNFGLAYDIHIYHVDETSMEAKVYFCDETERETYGYYCRLRRID
jgi:hypothetical protein